MGFWFLVFFVTPIVEMYLLIRVGGYIGALPTILLVILIGAAGVLLLRTQGLATLTRGLGRFEGGEVPAREMAEGMLLAVAGVLLIIPGFLTDAVGLLLLVPPVRAAAARRMLGRVVVAAGASPDSRSGDRSHPGDRFRRAEGSHSGGDVIEGEFESRTESDHSTPSVDKTPPDDHQRRLR